MLSTKNYILILVIALISLAIYFIEKIGVQRVGSDAEVIPVVSRQERENDRQENFQIESGEPESNIMKQENVSSKSKKYELGKEITTPDGFINTEGQSLKINDLIGKKVILVDFWTYSCINCQRTIPYLNSWYEKYKDKGFVIIGIHTPEFEFEKDFNNVKLAVERFGIKFPVVLDNDYSTWTAYKNRYWPRKYLIDIDGYIVFDHIGEGAYEETEKRIQEALEERMRVLDEKGIIDIPLTKQAGPTVFAGSLETYFGAARNEFFANGVRGIVGIQNNLSIPSLIDLNKLYLSGDWNISSEFSENIVSDSKVVYKYAAKDVFMVAEADSEVMVEVLLDGKPLEKGAGEDITKTSDGKTILKIKEPRLYKIIQNPQSAIGTLELIIKHSRIKAFTFTFG